MQPIDPSSKISVLDLQGLSVSVTDRNDSVRKEEGLREKTAQVMRDDIDLGPSNLSLTLCDD